MLNSILPTLLLLATLSTRLTPVTAQDCALSLSKTKWTPSASNLKHLCLGQGAGSYTFTMVTGISTHSSRKFRRETDTTGNPIDTGDAPPPENTDVKFLIYDNDCSVVNVYDFPQCGLPFTIHDRDLPYAISITDVGLDSSDPDVTFKYAAGEYLTGNNHCTCSGLKGQKGAACKCAFPVAGA